MTPIIVEYAAVIPASPERIHAVFADYVTAHAAILPKPFFTGMDVEHGGHGAGTVALVHTNSFGMKRTLRVTVTEPEPGRTLVETDSQVGITTTFSFDPLAGGEQTRVTLRTESRPSPGPMGLLERWMMPSMLRRLYRQELENLTTYLQTTDHH